MHSDPRDPDDDAPAAPGGARAADLRLVVPRDPAAVPDEDVLDAWMLAVGRHHDRLAFEKLFEHFAPRLKGWLIRTGSAPELADDLVQDTFVMLWRKADKFDPSRAHVAAWLFTIARNLRVDRHRGLCETWLSLDSIDADLVADPAIAAETQLALAQSGDDVRRALTQLSSDQRTLVQLSFYEDKSHSAIAGEMRLPLGTVKTRLRAAATRLRHLLEEHRS